MFINTSSFSFTYVSNPMPDSSMCRAPTPRLRTLQLQLPDFIDLDQLMLPVCVRFSCCFPIPSATAAVVCFSCCSLIANCSLFASASAAAPRLCLLRLLFHDCIPAVLEGSSPCTGPMFLVEFEVNISAKVVRH